MMISDIAMALLEYLLGQEGWNLAGRNHEDNTGSEK